MKVQVEMFDFWGNWLLWDVWCMVYEVEVAFFGDELLLNWEEGCMVYEVEVVFCGLQLLVNI